MSNSTRKRWRFPRDTNPPSVSEQKRRIGQCRKKVPWGVGRSVRFLATFLDHVVLCALLHKGLCNVNPANRSLLCRFNILYLARNVFHGGQPPNPRVRCALAGIVGPEVLTYGGQPPYPRVCYAVLLSICI